MALKDNPSAMLEQRVLWQASGHDEPEGETSLENQLMSPGRKSATQPSFALSSLPS